ncbi:MAG: HlyD family efflux transporter periplasmic adaptor subunit, partial [Azospirillaceae bacterium]
AGAAAVLALAARARPGPPSARAPAGVVPHEPAVVAAPLAGVISEVVVEPNESVAPGDLLFVYDDTELRSARAVAERTLAIAEAELQRARQGAFDDREQGARLAVLEARRALRAAELDTAEARLARVRVTADRAGVAVFADSREWTGRPVSVGERVMTIADPDSVRLRADLPATESIVLAEGADVTFFLDAAPLAPREAVVTAAAYEAAPTAEGTLAYRVEARFADAGAPPRLGLRGTARITGSTVPLAFYLFRRPIAWARGTLGL